MTLFESSYIDFERFVEKYELITREDKEIVIAYSGGKDASLMCEMLYEYKKRNNLSLKLELLVARFPKFLYETNDANRLKMIEEAFKYWRQKGVEISYIDYNLSNENEFLDADNPCKICAKIKTKLLGEYIRSKRTKNKVLALGMNLDDCLSWVLEIFLIAGKYSNLNEIKKEDYDLYKYILTLAIRTTHKLYDQKTDTKFIRPVMIFTNKIINEIVNERNIPLIPEDCRKLTKKNTFNDSPRREFTEAIKIMRDRYNNEKIDTKAAYNCYESFMNFVNKKNIIPSIDDMNDFMTNSYMV